MVQNPILLAMKFNIIKANWDEFNSYIKFYEKGILYKLN